MQCTKLNKVHSQQQQLKVVLKEQLKGLSQVTVHFRLWISLKECQGTGNGVGKQLGIPTYFRMMSCADLRWYKYLCIINKLNKHGLNEEELKNLSHQKRCDLLNNDPILVARRSQDILEVHFLNISYKICYTC